MSNILTLIDNYICEIEKQMPTYIYLILCESNIDTNKKHLLSIDETLIQYMLKLDNDTTIDRMERKQKIIRIQQIQKSIDKIMEIIKSQSNQTKSQSTTQEVEVYKLKKINDYIHKKNCEINELKIANAELKIKLYDYTKNESSQYIMNNITSNTK